MSISLKIQLSTDDSLKFDTSDKLGVKISPKSGNTLTVESDGLYAHAIPGQPGSTGTGYPDGYRSANGIMSGVTDPYDTTTATFRMVGPSIMHRIFTCTDVDGASIALRTVDKMYPGDMYRVHDDANAVWNYYIITRVNSTGTAVAAHSGIVASIPDSATDVN